VARCYAREEKKPLGFGALKMQGLLIPQAVGSDHRTLLKMDGSQLQYYIEYVGMCKEDSSPVPSLWQIPHLLSTETVKFAS
jgi:hypothetical protein